MKLNDPGIYKKHWYDGWIYRYVLDAKDSPLRNKIIRYIEPDTRVLDVGCGTGGLSLRLAQKCRFVLGIDISEKMISQAEKRKKKEHVRNVCFLQADATRVQRNVNEQFDVAIFSFVIHEIFHHQRITMLKQIAKVSRSLLIYDYHMPLPRNLYGLSPPVIEFFTSRDHFANFKDYRRRGGLDPILQEAGLVVTNENINSTGIFRLVAVEAS